MKKWICLLLILLVPGSALAGDYWTSRDDFHYHALNDCQGLSRRVPISKGAAEEFEKFACPVCVPEEDDGEEPRAVARGGTIVLCFSDAWLARPELTSVFGWGWEEPYRGDAAEREMAARLHGEAYRIFREQYAETGSAEALARNPDILEHDTHCQILNMRHIGSRWYVALRPEEGFGDSYSIYWRIDENTVTMEDGELRSSFDRQTVESWLELPLERSNSKAVCDMSNDWPMEIKVFRELGANIAVITLPDGDANALDEQRLRLNGTDLDLAMDGYMDGGAAVFCCILTDGELHALQNDPSIKIWHEVSQVRIAG